AEGGGQGVQPLVNREHGDLPVAAVQAQRLFVGVGPGRPRGAASEDDAVDVAQGIGPGPPAGGTLEDHGRRAGGGDDAGGADGPDAACVLGRRGTFLAAANADSDGWSGGAHGGLLSSRKMSGGKSISPRGKERSPSGDTSHNPVVYQRSA